MAEVERRGELGARKIQRCCENNCFVLGSVLNICRVLYLYLRKISRSVRLVFQSTDAPLLHVKKCCVEMPYRRPRVGAFVGGFVFGLRVKQEVSLSNNVSAVGDVLAVLNTTTVFGDRYTNRRYRRM